MDKDVSVKVAGASYDMSESVKGLVLSVHKALKDGFQLDQDLAPIMGAVMSLVGSMKMDEVKAEMDADKGKAIKSFLIPASEILDEIVD